MKPYTFVEKLAKFKPASDIFVVNGTSGNDQGVARLFPLSVKTAPSSHPTRNLTSVIGSNEGCGNN